MFDPSIMRRMEVQQGDSWVHCEDMGRLMKGDVFRMFDPDGSPVKGSAGEVCWTVESTPAVHCWPVLDDQFISSVADS